MARIVKLGQLLPEDIEFQMADGSKILAPGDPPIHQMMELVDVFEKLEKTNLESENGSEPGTEVGLTILRELDAKVLDLLRLRNPELEQSPFGVYGVQHFVVELLAAYNISAGIDPDEPNPTPASTEKKKKTTTPKSRQSSGSPSS